MVTSKKIDVDVMLTNCNFIVIFPIYVKFKAIWKPDSAFMVCNTYILINSNVLFSKNWKQN